MILLLTAALLSIIIYVLYGEPSDLYLGVILVIVVVATCYETYHQEVKSEDFLQSLKTLVPDLTVATRGGEQVTTRPDPNHPLSCYTDIQIDRLTPRWTHP